MKINKALLHKLLAAFKYGQAKLRTAYHITFVPGSPREFEQPETLMTIERTGRGDEDRDHFLIRVNVKEMQLRTAKQLRRDAGHELLHALLWDMRDSDPPGAEENAVYKLQRAFFGEDDEA